jgi:hypothetical protein
MKTQLQTLKRLVDLYKAVERLHSTELQRTTTSLQKAEQAVGMQREIVNSARVDGRNALKSGDRMEWTMAEVRSGTSDWRRRRLDVIRSEREGLRDTASEQYLASRLKSEQVKRVTEAIAERIAIEEGRRVQAASDDRFLARKRWSDAQERISQRAK